MFTEQRRLDLDPANGGVGGGCRPADEGLGSLPARRVNPIVTIDGPAASGKSTLGIALARHYHVPYIDTGAYYRTLGLLALREKLDLSPLKVSAREIPTVLELQLKALAGGVQLQFSGVAESGEQSIKLKDEELSASLHTNQVSDAASLVARVPAVRAALIKLIRQAAASGGILVGRDCGSKIYPDAELKIYLEASPEIRALRRTHQYSGLSIEEISNNDPEYLANLQAINERDRRDSERESDPLRCPKGARIINTDHGDPDLTFNYARVSLDTVMFDLEEQGERQPRIKQRASKSGTMRRPGREKQDRMSED